MGSERCESSCFRTQKRTLHLIGIQIVCISIIGPLMLAAFLEWLLFLAAFLYCLVKVFQKAEHWSIKVLAVTMMIIFTSLR